MQVTNLDTAGFKAYNSFFAIKQHFTSKYDYFKYNGKVKTTVDSFKRRNDRYQFAKLERSHKTDLIQFLVSNAIKDNIGWIGDLTTEEAEENYRSWKRRIESLKYTFKSELKWMCDYIEANNLSFDDLFLIEDNDHPLILRFLLDGTLSLETVVILDKVLKFSRVFTKKMVDDPIWMDYNRKIQKYSAFIAVDVDDYKKILRNVFL